MKKELLDFMARSCHYAQSHMGDPYAWIDKIEQRKYLFQCTSFQMACFLAQNTIGGEQGVEYDVIIEELSDNTLDKNGMMCKSIDEWKVILQTLVDELGGWKDNGE